MVTRILFDPRRDLTDGTTSSSTVTLEATPTGVREDGSVVVLPSTLSFTVNTAADLVQLAAPAASWAWRLVARQDAVVKQQRTVRFTDVTSVKWAELVDVDPATLGETDGHARQWDATFFQLVELIASATGDLASLKTRLDAITANAPGAFDTFLEVATQLGLDETTVTALTALVAGKEPAGLSDATRASLSATYSTVEQGVDRALGFAAVLASAAATVISDATVAAGNSSVTSASGAFKPSMNGQAFYLHQAGPVLVSGTYAWNASPLVGVFTYVSATQGTLSVTATTAVTAGEMIVGADATGAVNAAIAKGRGTLPAGSSYIIAGELSVGNRQSLVGAGRRLSRLFSVTPKGNVVTSAWTTGPELRDFSIYGNGFGAQPANTDPGQGITPNWANSGCGVIYAAVTQGVIERVDTYHCGGDALTANRNGIAGIYITMGCTETQVVGCLTKFCRNGINEDNYFSGTGQLWNPLSNTFDRNTTTYCRFGLAVDSGSLSRGVSIANHVARYCVSNGIEVHSSNFVTITAPRCEFNGVNYTGSGIQIYGTSSTIFANHISILNPICHGNGTHGIKVSDFVTNYRIVGGILTRNFRHGLYINNQANDGTILGLGVRDNGQGNDAPGTYDGVHVTSSLRVHIQVNALDDQGTPSQNYGIRCDGTADFITIDEGSKFTGNAAGSVVLAGSSSRNGARSRGTVLARAQGFAGEAFARAHNTGGFQAATGDQRATLVGLMAGEVITNLWEHVTVVGASLTVSKLGIWDTAGNLLASTADLSSQFTALGVRGGALSTPWTCPADGGYYIGAVFLGTTIPTVRGTSGTTGYTGQAASGSVPPSVSTTGKADIGVMTINASGSAPWVAWS